MRGSFLRTVLLVQMCLPLTAWAAGTQPAVQTAELSQIRGTAALEKVGEWNRKTEDSLGKDPLYAGFFSDALAVTQSQDRLAVPRFMNGFIWNFWQDAHHPRGILRRTTLASYRLPLTSWVTRLDIDALAAHEHKDWVFEGTDCLEPEERYCLVRLSEGGEDASTLREYDARAGLFVLNGFQLSRSRQTAAWVDRDTLLVGRDWDGTGATLTTSGYPFVIRRLVRGRHGGEPAEVVRGEKTDVAVSPVSLSDGDGNHLVIIQRSPTFFTNHYAILEGMSSAFHGSDTGHLRWLSVPEHSELHGLLHGRLIFSLNESWTPEGGSEIPSGSLVAVDPSPQGAAPEIVFSPSAGQAVNDVAVTRNTVIVSFLDHVRGRAAVLAPPANGSPVKGWTQTVLPLPDMATIRIADADHNSDQTFLTAEGYLDPPQVWLTGKEPWKTEKMRQMPALFDASALITEQRSARSPDGTMVPYFVVRPRDVPLNGQNPTLLTAYGGFQVSSTPVYSPELGRLWLTQGGIYAVANIRGGGEFGPAWHEAGRKTHRQRVYDDFAAVGRDLISHHLTSPAHLGIRGRSNGGLLAGVEFTQHPDLWNAVIIGVPLLDMLHYETMSAGASWADEYGSVSVPEERKFLEKISPLQQLKPGVSYPVPFIFTSTLDDRVGPVHARLFAARLEALGRPFYYYEDTEGGHSGTVNAQEIAHERALEAVYLNRQLRQGAPRK